MWPMTDPAEAAAKRAHHYKAEYSWKDRTSGVAAAREALKPIRERCDQLKAAAGERLHPTDPDYDIGNAFDDGVLSLIDELAPLIYTREELTNDR